MTSCQAKTYMWQTGWREQLWSDIEEGVQWDIVIIGGGITGAGILREASRIGLKVLLVEQGDFASGTSSRSSKLVHGGLRYLKTGQWRLTLESVRERERLLRESGGLVSPQGFVTAIFKGRKPSWWTMKLGLIIYDLMARRRSFRGLAPAALEMLVPRLRQKGLRGALAYPDAQTDDVRLTLRVIEEAQADGGHAINYVQATELQLDKGVVCGVRVRDRLSGSDYRLNARLVINAAGAWCDRLRMQVGGETRLRPLRGSHLVFDYADLPCAQAVGFFHPKDGRPVFAVPWDGRVLLGTTDLDHEDDLDSEPRCTQAEADYLVEGARFMFPALSLSVEDAVASYAGVRPVIGSGNSVKPSDESREHGLWQEKGLLSITGGKLTTFRTTALEVLAAARRQLPGMPTCNPDALILAPITVPPKPAGMEAFAFHRLYARYGQQADRILSEASDKELERIPTTDYLWAELSWAAKHEAVMHLQDLMLRRTRLGLLLRDGGQGLLDQVRERCQPLLGWDDARWESEAQDYCLQWQRNYAPPGPRRVAND